MNKKQQLWLHNQSSFIYEYLCRLLYMLMYMALAT